ncbi:uncharacterized protein LOC125026359 [Penaeus chinensis]|uniref:uncharacterized protein LOC125026359 n=1 Tax=Penaeus chinensis TaxID=139456 RepID=UPI001FB839AD|nr:uncharacterized protein LOC125026359 [Penaeus chinensis]XP_047470715.1 uncharacterized protein LOC125026359 [Penaeus chinensis]
MACPLSLEETLDGIAKIFEKEHGKNCPKTLLSSLLLNAEKAEMSEDVILSLDKKLKTWHTQNKISLVEADVPSTILPFGYSASLVDVRVKSRGPDDKIYKNNPEIRSMVPRGLTLIHLHGHEKKYEVILYANKKFTGGVGDEDESQPENDDSWREYCLAPPETATDLICMTKLNGEAAHFSGRFLCGQFYIITGSKNVHMILKNKDEIDLYEGSRYSIAKVIARAVFEALENLDQESRLLVYSLLHHTKCTVLSEILQPKHQHIVNLCALDKPEVNVLMLTPTFVDEEESSFTAFPPHHMLDMMAALGFACAPFTVTSPDTMSEQKERVRNELHKEGEVMYFVNGKGETIGIAKVKTCWYVVLRALREQTVNSFTAAKKRENWTLQGRIALAHKRLTSIQHWLYFSNEYLAKWKKLSADFLTWLHKEIENRREIASNIRPHFPIMWERFLREEDETDNFVS